MTEYDKVFWSAVASWLRKEASEAAQRRDDSITDIFSGLARAIDYGVQSVELAESKEALRG